MLIETSISKGRAAALVLDLRAILADILFIVLAYFGIRPLLENLKSNIWIGVLPRAAVVLFGAYYLRKLRTSEQLSATIHDPRKGLQVIKGFLLNFLNVGVLLFWLAATVSIGNLLDNDPEHILIFCTLPL